MAAALIYIRQSRHKAYERTVSPEVQEETCRSLPAVASCDEVEVYRDLDVSGGSLRGRRGFLALMERLKRGGVAVVAAYDQSRAFRSTRDALEFYAFLAEHREVEVVFVHGRFDRSAVGGFTYTTLAAAHELERRMTGEKIREAKRWAATRGEMVGAVPAGYRRHRDGTVTIDEDVAPIVRRVFTEYASGRYSSRELARRLNAEGAIPPSFKGGWRADTITQLVANEAYIGITYVNRRRREGEPIAACWPALVDRETFEACRRRLGRHPGWGGRKHRDYVFQGLLRCVCGGRLHGHFVRGRRRYYCRRTDLAEPCSGGRSVREDDLLPQAREIFVALEAMQPEDFTEALERMPPAASRRPAPDALRQIDAALERATEAFVRGWWSEERLLAERERLEALRQEIEREAEAPGPRVHFRGVLDAWDRGDARARRDLLACLFDELHVREGEIVGYTPAKGYEAEVVALMERVCRSSPGGIRGNSGEHLRLIV
ncbi:MAG TPA: recombinase family protein [Gemmataceae bacterium]|nr:recombinase family protein [Gemmataceae bacterium]